jgi:threonine dehydratase
MTSDDVNQAYQRLQSVLLLPTPLEYCSWLSERIGGTVYLKLEVFRETRTFKVRGAFNVLLQLPAAARARGVVTASGGNHALAVAYAAHRLGIPATVVMTTGAPANVADLCRAYGANVRVQGAVYEEAEGDAQALSHRDGLVFIPAFDDPAVIAGQGTIGREIQTQWPQCTDIVVPVGGGGLIAGIAISYQDQPDRPRIVGAEPAGAAALASALETGERAALANPQSRWAEKLMPRQIGARPFAIAQAMVDHVLRVPEAAIESAVMQFLARSNLLVEGSAAITAAAMEAHVEMFRGRHVALVISGGNINLALLAEALGRSRGKDGDGQ